jgi:hypothetical protein
MKSFVGWEIGFGLGVCFVPISIAEKGPDSALLRPCPTARCVVTH